MKGIKFSEKRGKWESKEGMANVEMEKIKKIFEDCKEICFRRITIEYRKKNGEYNTGIAKSKLEKDYCSEKQQYIY